MFFLRRYRADPEFMIGLRDALPQALGLSTWGLMTGVALATSGMSVFEAVAMTLVVYAGSSQLAATPLIVAGAPAWVVLATAVCVNLRFVVFSLHLRPFMMHLPRWQRLGQGYFTADLTYVLFTRRFATPGITPAERLAQQAYIAGNCCINWCSWMAASLVGIAFASFIPREWGLGFAGILCLLGVLCSLATTRLRMLAGLVAGSVAVAVHAAPLRLNIVIAIGAAVLLCLLLEQRVRPELRDTTA